MKQGDRVRSRDTGNLGTVTQAGQREGFVHVLFDGSTDAICFDTGSLEPLGARIVKVHIGTSVLTRDIVWCECGRGVSLHGTWTFCPRCGGTIDQESYHLACVEARKNGSEKFYRTPEDVETIAALTAERDALIEKMERALRGLGHYTQRYNHDLERIEALTAERERLREALQLFRDHYPSGINPDLDRAYVLSLDILDGTATS